MVVGRDLTTMQWARLLRDGALLRVRADDRVAEGRLRSITRREVALDYPPGCHDGFVLTIERRSVLKVWRCEDGEWRRLRSRAGRQRELPDR